MEKVDRKRFTTKQNLLTSTNIASFVLVVLVAFSLPMMAAEHYFGEPVRLEGRAIYFTSWKYVRQGSFNWRVQADANTSEAERNIGTWLKGDGTLPAVFETKDMPRGVRLVAQRASKIPFKDGQFAAQVFDGGKYKTWYVVEPCADSEAFSSREKILPGHDGHVAYAESTDGINWTRPNLGLYEYSGNLNNNIVWRGDLHGSVRGFHGGSVFVDPSSTNERYKMVYLGILTDEEWAAFEKKYPGEADTKARRPDVAGFRCVFGFFGAVSPDGLHWKSLPEPLMIQHADTQNTCYYDVEHKLYVAYVRAWQVNERIADNQPANSISWINVGRRSIGRAVSKDFRHFTPPEIVVDTGADMPPSHVYYTNCKTTLPGCSDNHVMFPWIWEQENDGGAVWLLSSADGRNWSHVSGGPVLSPGKWGEPDGGYVSCTGNLLEYPGSKWGIGYDGHPIPHKYPGRDFEQRKGLYPGVPSVSGLATWPKGRLVALQADDEGEFGTVFIVPPRQHLRVNADVAPTGYLKLAIRVWGSDDDLPGRTLAESDRLIGNSLEARVTWKRKDTVGGKGQPIMLHVQMKQAKLFGFEFY